MANRKFKYDTHEDEMFLRIVKDPKHSGLTKPTYDYVFNGYKEAYANHKDYKDPAPEWHHYNAEKQVWKFYFGKEATLPWTKPEVFQPMGDHMTHTNISSARGSAPSQPQTKETVDTRQNRPAASPAVRNMMPDSIHAPGNQHLRRESPQRKRKEREDKEEAEDEEERKKKKSRSVHEPHQVSLKKPVVDIKVEQK